MFRGTERFPADVYNRIVTTIGADANAYTTDDHTAYHLAMAAEDLEQVMEIESDRFQNLSYAESRVPDRGRRRLRRVPQGPHDPEFALYERSMAAAFERHRTATRRSATSATSRSMPTLYDYSRDVLQPLLPAREHGAVDRRRRDAGRPCCALVEKYYGGWQRGYVAPQIPAEPEQTARAAHRRARTTARRCRSLHGRLQAAASTTRPTARASPPISSPTSRSARPATRTRSSCSTSKSSRISTRAPRTTATRACSTIYARDQGPGKVDYVLGVIDATIAHFRAAPPDAAAARGPAAAPALRLPDGPADAGRRRVARRAVRRADRRSHGLDRLYATYAAITPADVQAAAERYLRTERRTVGVLRSRP